MSNDTKSPDYGIDLESADISIIKSRSRALESNIEIMNAELKILMYDSASLDVKIKDARERIKQNKQLPYLLSMIKESVQVPDDGDEEGATKVAAGGKAGTGVIMQTSARHIVYLPNTGLLKPEVIEPGMQVGINKDNYALFEELPPGYDTRAQSMEVVEKPTERCSDIGGLDDQIQELFESVILPITQSEKFEAIGIRPPRGVLMYGPPGTGKTLLARACAAESNSTFFKLAGPQLVQKFVGDGAKIIRHAFKMAKEKAPSIIFIDELDAIGVKRHDDGKNSDREVQRTMLELLNQLDGFTANDRVKVLAATNRVDTLDPALLRSGRLDRKIEFPAPNEEARAKIIAIHSRKLKLSADVNFKELARCCPDFNGAQCMAICVEAGMAALRRDATEICHEDFITGIYEIQSFKKKPLKYYT